MNPRRRLWLKSRARREQEVPTAAPAAPVVEETPAVEASPAVEEAPAAPPKRTPRTRRTKKKSS